MQPIHELLNRIKWDKEFGAANFRLGYHDRVLQRLIFVDFNEISFVPGDHFGFYVVDEEGEQHHVPLHRVREVYRNDELIWERPD